jgi:hypothetical protein
LVDHHLFEKPGELPIENSNRTAITRADLNYTNIAFELAKDYHDDKIKRIHLFAGPERSRSKEKITKLWLNSLDIMGVIDNYRLFYYTHQSSQSYHENMLSLLQKLGVDEGDISPHSQPTESNIDYVRQIIRGQEWSNDEDILTYYCTNLYSAGILKEHERFRMEAMLWDRAGTKPVQTVKSIELFNAINKSNWSKIPSVSKIAYDEVLDLFQKKSGYTRQSGIDYPELNYDELKKTLIYRGATPKSYPDNQNKPD